MTLPSLLHPGRPLALVALLAAAACGGGSKSTPPAPTLSSIALTPSSLSLAAGATRQMLAVGTFSDGSTADITSQATWTSGNTAVATVSSGGLVTVAAGAAANDSTSITASHSGRTQVAILTVTGGGGATVTALTVTPATASLAPGATQQLTATATWSSGPDTTVTGQATWTSSNGAVATVSAAGLVTAAAGATNGQTATITGTYQGQSDTTAITIVVGGATVTALTVTPATASLAPGATQQLTATATWSSGPDTTVTGQTTWTSSATGVATVSAAGLVTAAAGATNGQTATITGTYQGQSDTTAVTIVVGGGGGLTLSPAGGSVPLGRTLQLVATLTAGGTDVTRTATWASSSAAFTVSAAGLVTPVGTAGQTATISATSGGSSGQVTLTVASARPAVGPGASNDPLIAQQWHLQNTGQAAFADTTGTAGEDIHPGPAYAVGYTGQGVKVGVLDSGLEIGHEDLADNVVPGSWNFVDSTSNPTTTHTDGDHGTMVTGLIAAVSGNGKGGMGVAPAASLNGYNILNASNTQTLDQVVASLGQSSANPTSNDVWVFNQSFGTGNTSPGSFATARVDAYYAGGNTLRGGRGAVYVKSAGNGFEHFGSAGCAETTPGSGTFVGACCFANSLKLTCQNASMDPYNTLPQNIVVGALNAKGTRSVYSTAGSALWVSAPGGEYGLNASYFARPQDVTPFAFDPAMVSTDDSGCAKGASQSPPPASWGTPSDFNANVGGVNVGCNYTNTMNGTSSAAPVTSGVVALMLEANPTLTWRDVKHILATTADRVDPGRAGVNLNVGGSTYEAEQPWFQNAVGRWFNNWYGFGRVNAGAAVEAARTYAYGSLGAYQEVSVTSSTLNASIPDGSVTGVSSSLNVTGGLTVEAVMVQVALTHAFWGDLSFELVSPSGTRSVIFNAVNGFNNLNGSSAIWLASNAFYGESANGSWTLRLVDVGAGDTGTLVQWQIVVAGH